MKKGKAIHFSVHPTPMKPGDTQQTYHVRHCQDYVMHSRELREHINSYTLISEGMFEMFLDTLKREIAEQLLMGHGVHLDGIGRFCLQLGTKKTKDEQGRWRTKTYTAPSQLTGHEVTIDGISFVPDKEMLNRLQDGAPHFVRDKGEYEQEVPRGELLKTLADYCQQHGSFTRRVVQHLFCLSRYKADQLLTDLVNEEYPKYYRQKAGTTWVYRKTGT